MDPGGYCGRPFNIPTYFHFLRPFCLELIPPGSLFASFHWDLIVLLIRICVPSTIFLVHSPFPQVYFLVSLLSLHQRETADSISKFLRDKGKGKQELGTKFPRDRRVKKKRRLETHLSRLTGCLGPFVSSGTHTGSSPDTSQLAPYSPLQDSFWNTLLHPLFRLIAEANPDPFTQAPRYFDQTHHRLISGKSTPLLIPIWAWISPIAVLALLSLTPCFLIQVLFYLWEIPDSNLRAVRGFSWV